jgi:hypothetical protein
MAGLSRRGIQLTWELAGNLPGPGRLHLALS